MSCTSATDIGAAQEQVHEYIVDKYGMPEKRKYRAYYESQSFNRLFDIIDPEIVLQLSARTKQTIGTESVPTTCECTRRVDSTRTEYPIDYSRKDHGKTIPVSDIQSEMEDIGIVDVPVQELTIRIDDDGVYDELYDVLDVAGVCGMGAFKQPLYGTLAVAEVNLESIRERMQQNHPVNYFSPPRVDDDIAYRGLGWKYQTLDLVEIHSRNAWIEDSTAVAYDESGDGMTIREVEDAIFNYDETMDHTISPINSRVVTRSLRDSLNFSETGTKGVSWDSVSGWGVAEEVSE